MAAVKAGKQKLTSRAKVIDRPRLLANGIEIPRTIRAYSIPYFTRYGSDTEYLISNPNAGSLTADLSVFGKNCKVVKRLKFKLGPNCTRTVRIRAIVPDHAGHSVLLASLEPVVHLLYYRRRDIAVVGGEQAGRDNLFNWLPREQSRTYGFGYRTIPLGHDTLGGAVFVSNPHAVALVGWIAFYDQKCALAVKKRVRINPGCTVEYAFPRGRFGYGRITVSKQAAINVLHFAASAQGVAAAELIGEADRLSTPTTPPSLRSRILFDDTHQCRPGGIGDWTTYESALINAGYSVAHYTAPAVTLAELKKHDVFVVAVPRVSYSAAEKQAMSDFVNTGGGLLIVQDFGNAPWSPPTREILNLFGTNDDNNFMQDPTNHFLPGQTDDVVFDYKRNFLAHPIVNGWKSFHVDAASSLSGGAGWTTVVETDDDSIPARRPAVIARSYGPGRIVAFGDSNTWADHLINNLENKLFGVRCAEWLLFRI